MEPIFRKSRYAVPARYWAWEAAGLRWLAEAHGGAAVVEVVDVGGDHLDLARLTTVSPSATAAYTVGQGLARTHRAGATAFGAPPPGWSGAGYLGPLSEPLPLALGTHGRWGDFYADERLRPVVALGRERGVFDASDAAAVDVLADRLHVGDFDTDDPPARLHGDLWSGNLMWTPNGAVLIDPAAHGGHRETDLAMLQLFGVPHWADLLAGYQSVWPLSEGWKDRVVLHQIHPLLVHAVLFGGGYAGRALAAVRRYR